MKKILVLLALILLMQFFGCSSAPYHDTVLFDRNLDYSYENLNFDGLNQNDILYYTVDDYIDLEIMILEALQRDMIEEKPLNLLLILETLESLNSYSNISLQRLLKLSTTELYNLAMSHSVILTVDDIVGFNDLKATLNLLNESISISKVDYIEYRLGRDLTEEEIEGFIELQYYYNNIVMYNGQLLSDMNFEAFSSELNNLYDSPNEEELNRIEIAFEILKLLQE